MDGLRATNQTHEGWCLPADWNEMTILKPPGLIEYIDVVDAGARVSLATSAQNDDHRCAGCGSLLFDGDDGFESAEGRAFSAPSDSAAVTQHAQCLRGSRSVEVRCATCDSHVGHVFPDGPWPTGLRYQIDDDAPALLDS